MSNGPDLDRETRRAEPAAPEPKANTATLKRFFTVVVAGSLLGGCAVVDWVRILTTDDRKVGFWVVDGVIDEDSVRVNNWFPVPTEAEVKAELEKEGKVLKSVPTIDGYPGHEVFSFPFDLGGDPTYCQYKDAFGYTYKVYYPPAVPPPGWGSVPPCPPR